MFYLEIAVGLVFCIAVGVAMFGFRFLFRK
jgi:hypothetical protein